MDTETLTVATDNGSATWVRNSYGGITNGRFTVYRDSAECLSDNGMTRFPWSLWDAGCGEDVYVTNFRTVVEAKSHVTDAVGVLATKLPV